VEDHNARTTITDPKTGRPVWKMTSWDDCHCLATYMYFQSFSGDGRYLTFASNRSGIYELYRLEVESGDTVQLTNRPDRNEDGTSLARQNVHPDGKEVIYRDEQRFMAIDIATREDRIIAENVGSDIRFTGYANLTGDGKQIVFRYEHSSGCIGIGLAPFVGGSVTDAFRLSSVDKGLDHLQGSTGNPDLITFCILPDGQNDPDGSDETRARCHVLDTATGEARPFLICPPGHRATHEYWAPDGRLYYHRKTVPGWTPTSIDSIDVDGGDHQVHFTSPDRQLGHSAITRDCKRIVSDVQQAGSNELYEIDIATGSAKTLCWPDSSLCDGFIGHVHPAFDFDGRYAIYTSDVTGKAAVYVMPLDQV